LTKKPSYSDVYMDAIGSYTLVSL